MPIQEVRKDDGPQLKLIANALASSKKIIVVTGAGISTNCGIPVSQAFLGVRILDLLLMSNLGFSLRAWAI